VSGLAGVTELIAFLQSEMLDTPGRGGPTR
jgi:hypothetical protein